MRVRCGLFQAQEKGLATLDEAQIMPPIYYNT
jgi:hypothetical protein